MPRPSPKKPTFAVTLGDPLGIGPEIVQKSLKDPSIRKLADWKIFGRTPSGKLTQNQAGKFSWDALVQAVESLKKGECQGLVTAPVSKEHLQKAGFPFPGQTEFLTHAFGASKSAMMLSSPLLRVVLVTIHVALKDVFSNLTAQKIVEKIQITHDALIRDFGIRKPRIAVCGLNPHAGENGLFGTEEQTLIIPAIQTATRKKINVSGPYASDTVFHRAVEGHFDAVICHYHDQGLIPLKTLSFYEGVNTTLGLPIIRTSPDHGCAFDIAGKGIANPASMKAALRLALSIFKNRK